MIGIVFSQECFQYIGKILVFFCPEGGGATTMGIALTGRPGQSLNNSGDGMAALNDIDDTVTEENKPIS